MQLKLTFLGTGTSTGIPMLACHCPTCISNDPNDKRMRSSILLQWQKHTLIVDTTPEFRLQMLRANCQHLDAILITHTHADHINGLDDLRQLTFKQNNPLELYASKQTISWLKQRFNYIWGKKPEGGAVAKLNLNPINEPFKIKNLTITPIPVKHGSMNILGYRFGPIAYISDVSEIPTSSIKLLQNLQILILDAVRYRPHPTHFHIEKAIQVSQQINPKLTYFTHINHDIQHQQLTKELPANIKVAYDTLTIQCKQKS